VTYLQDEGTVIDGTQQTTTTSFQDGDAPDFSGVNPDYIMHRLKLIKPEVLTHCGLKPFYKSYSSWQKLTADQRNKVIS